MTFARSLVPTFCAALVSSLAPSIVAADVLGTQTITNANHYGYYGFPSTSQFNTKATVGPFSGTARVIRAQGTITRVHPDAWVSSIRVLPSGPALAVTQPWYQFSNVRDFPTPTVNVSTTIYIPGGFNLAPAMTFEMYSIDAEQFVPGLDARSTITYTFEDSFAPGTAEYIGRLETSDPKFNRPIQFPSSAPSGWTQPMLSGRFPHYDVQPFFVDTAGRYDLVTANEFESHAVLYQNSFDPQNSLANVMWALPQTGNVMRNNTFNNLPPLDDATGGTVINADLVPGVQYYFVTSAYAAPGDPVDGGPFIGRYSNIITGAGNVTLGIVPEPTGALTLATSAALMLNLRRRGRPHP
jgi:hypothetical protein